MTETLSRWIGGLLSWGLVRVLAELQILSRVSYAMLVLVPLLAGVWPAVDAWVQDYNSAVDRATERINASAAQLSTALNEIRAVAGDGVGRPGGAGRLEGLGQAAERLDKLIWEGADAVERTLPLQAFLPVSWALAYFAALAVVVGQTTYQVGASRVLKQESREEFVRRYLRDYKDGAKEQFLNSATAEAAEEVSPEGPLHNARKRLSEATKALSDATKGHENALRGIGALVPDFDKIKDEKEAGVIAAHAELLYEIEARRRPCLAFCSFLSYLVGVLLILAIICRQALAVGEAAGWL